MLISTGYTQLASLSAATGLTPPAGSRYVLLTAEAQNVRWRADGTAPTATVGQLLKTTDPPLLLDLDGSALQFIAATAGGIVNAVFFKQR